MQKLLQSCVTVVHLCTSVLFNAVDADESGGVNEVMSLTVLLMLSDSVLVNM